MLRQRETARRAKRSAKERAQSSGGTRRRPPWMDFTFEGPSFGHLARRWLLPGLTLLCALVLISACNRKAGDHDAPVSPRTHVDDQQRPPLDPTADPSGLDPGAADDGLREALREVRNRFACNRVSGCPAHPLLLGYGWKARPALERIFARARPRTPWRPRLLRIIAELGDPGAASTLRDALRDSSDEVRAYAIFGLKRLRDPFEDKEILRFARADGPFSTATSRLTARFMLYLKGVPEMKEAFLRELSIRARQSMGGTATWWGLHLCTLPGAPDCTPALLAAARHPTFIARRGVLEVIERGVKRQHVPALLTLLADPVPSLGRRAQAALIKLSGETALKRPADWRAWWRKHKNAFKAREEVGGLDE